MLRRLVFSVAVATFGTSAMAADLSYNYQGASAIGYAEEPSITPIGARSSYDWSGFYLGVNGGYGWTRQQLNSLSIDGTTFDMSVLPDRTLSAKGGSIGGTIGAQLEYHQFVFGLEGDVNASNIKGSRAIAPPDIGLRGTIDDYSTARFRVGYAVDRVLPYLTGGAFIASATVTGSSPTYLGTYEPSTKTTAVGWTLGGGLEIALTHDLSVKAEYLYARLPLRFSYTNISVPITGSATTSGGVNLVRVGLNYNFF